MTQWNTNPCGAVPTDKLDRNYFDRVEAERYRQQSWQRAYFDFEAFRDKNVLEVGIGHGTDLRQFARGGARCHGVDITDRHIELTKLNFALNGLPVDVRKADATNLPFPDNYFDCIYSFGVIHHIPDVERVVAELRRVLKPGGSLWITVYNRYSAMHMFRLLLVEYLLKGRFLTKGYGGVLATIERGADGVAIKPYVQLYSRRSLRSLLSEFRIEDISVRQLEAEHFWPVPIQKLLGPAITTLDHYLGWYVCAQATK